EHSPRIARITLVGVSDLWTGIRIAKTITLRDDSSSVRVDYTFSAGDDVARDAKPDFWMHQTMPRRGRVFAASPVGVQTLPRWNQDESWIFEPTRGWIGWLPQDDQSTGLAMTIPFQRVKFIRATHRR